MKEPTCFKNVENPSCIDLILTNKSIGFQNTMVIETGLSDFHKLTICTMKSYFHKQKPIIVKYRYYKYFNHDYFRIELLYQISKKGFHDIECYDFKLLFMATLNKYSSE